MSIKSTIILGGVLIIVLALALFFIPAPEKTSEEDLLVNFQEETQNTQIIIGYEKFGDEKIDANLAAIVDGYVAAFRETAEEFGESPSGRPYVLIIEDEEVVETDETVGVLLLVYHDFAGAHGLPRLLAHNFYKETGEEVSVGDMLAISSWTLVALAESTHDFFTEKLGDSFLTDGAEPSDANYKSFLIKEGEVTFFFEPYQVAVYALGPQEYTISY